MKRIAIAGFAAGDAMMIGGAVGAVSTVRPAETAPLMDPVAGIVNPMISGHAMLADRNLLENLSASPLHTTLVSAMKTSGVADALKADGLFTVFAPTNQALPAQLLERNKAQLARAMGYLVVPGRYDSRALLRAIGEGGGQAKLRTIEGGVLVARMNGPTNIILMDARGSTANIAIYDVYDKNGVMHVVDNSLEPGAPSRQIAIN